MSVNLLLLLLKIQDPFFKGNLKQKESPQYIKLIAVEVFQFGWIGLASPFSKGLWEHGLKSPTHAALMLSITVSEVDNIEQRNVFLEIQLKSNFT